MINSLVSVFIAVVGLAMVAVLVSRNSQTASVISSTATGFSQVLQAAVSPINGGGISVGLTTHG